MRPANAPPWYRDGLRFSCSGCGDCCRGEGYVYVDEDEIERLATFLEITREEFGRKFLRVDNGRLSLIDNQHLDCIFWRDGCTVYEARPRQCRTFPFWNENLGSPSKWKKLQAICPGAGEGRLYDLVEIRSLARRQGQTSGENENVG